jgi:sulfoxide reductase heme-binding subunit YedZ
MDPQRLMSRVIKPVIFVAALIPLGVLVWSGFNDGLGANPVEYITRDTGGWGLRFLIVTLAVTPLRRVSGWQSLIRLRRMLGLFAFFYLCLHFLTYMVLDAFFDVAYILDDILKRTYITLGFTAFCLLIPLAATSTNAMVRRLGGQRWRRLHRLVYLAAAAGCLHFLWQVKADATEPLIYLAVLALLLLARVPAVTSRMAGLRRGGGGKRASPARESAV